MDTELASEIAGDLSGAEAAASQARAALDGAREATRAAESAYRERQAEEAARLHDYEQATRRVKELYTAERERLEEAKRAAEEQLRSLDSKLEELTAGDPVETTPPPPASSASFEDRLADLTSAVEADASTGDSGNVAVEDEWYRTLLERNKNENGEAE